MKCNLCEILLEAEPKSIELLHHIRDEHKDVYTLHKGSSDANGGFRIEFIHLDVLKDDEGCTLQPIIVNRVADEDSEHLSKVPEPVTDKDDEINTQYVLINKTKKRKSLASDTRKRSWVWKYFDKLSNIIYRCNLCQAVLSIKGCNTNNMNRHVRTRHPIIFSKEIALRGSSDTLDTNNEVDTPVDIKKEELYASDRDIDEIESPRHKMRKSWVWSYFNRVSSKQAQCKICNRNIMHGGNATGNMNRHLKMLHNKTGYKDFEMGTVDYMWLWKVFETNKDTYTCKICQHQCIKYNNVYRNITRMLEHLELEHGVVSGDQIITGADSNATLE